MAGSFQNEIPPARINLKLDVGKGDAKKKMELPLKMMVMGDFSMKPKDDRVVDREKIGINKNNFEQVMEGMDLSLKYNVDDKLSGQEGRSLPVDLKIKTMKSFGPENIAKSIPSISRLLAARNLVKDLKSNLLDNREFRKRLEQVLKDSEASKALMEQLKSIVPDKEEEKESES
ncbi:type VI secretion system contractile sheath small subunit [Chitinispirillales bacterium ANBcel5]|uniref:type VI secretion system contractile sheath small subunit n=1 Tax=Cellulosispirillum alkaliphilum TaxID=3039283 RepID=UPI002A501FD8|nr:type VI secretion system contractile sheath small subunit [Chitinispirillales bacterium ANBcel5]